MARTKKTQNKIKSKIDAIKKINDSSDGITKRASDLYNDELSPENGIIRRNIDDFKDKTKAKKTQQTNVLSTLLNTVEGVLDDNQNSNDSPFVQKKLVRYAKSAASDTMKIAKQIVLDAVQNKLFAGDNVCGVNNNMPLDSIEISPKEIDFFDMLQINPDTTMGSIMYESTTQTGFVKMNTELYNTFDVGTYTFTKNDGSQLFHLQWDATLQKYVMSGITQNGDIRVIDFIREYYNRIEQSDLESSIKQAMMMTLQPDGTQTPAFTISMDWLNRLLDKIFSICDSGGGDEPLNQNSQNLLPEDEVDLEWYFDFESTEGIDIDDENARHRGVLKFKDCNNFELPIDDTHLEDFVYFIDTDNPETLIMDTINTIATEAAEESDHRFTIKDLEISLSFKYVLNLAKAIVGSVISPKLFLPVVAVYKSLKGLNLTAAEILQKLKRMFFEIIEKLFKTFIQKIWTFIKKDLLKFLQDFVVTILKNKLARFKAILASLISLLTRILETGLSSCEDLFEAILSIINGALSSSSSLPMPSLLLAFSDQAAGYSTDRAYMNAVEKLTNGGIDMEPIYGEENKTHTLLKGLIEGNSEEMDENSYVKIALKQTVIPSGPGGAVITPLVSGAGKIF